MFRIKIKEINILTPDTKSFVCEKPAGFVYHPGQAVSLAIDQDGWREEFRPFTFTSLVDDLHLEFIIKSYRERSGVTAKFDELKIGDELLMTNPWGAVEYLGPGIFVAGGSGITPFLAIFRELHRKGELDGNILFYANKTRADIILEAELNEMFSSTSEKPVYCLSREKVEGYLSGHITLDLIRSRALKLPQNWYLCGPPPMMAQFSEELKASKIEAKLISF